MAALLSASAIALVLALACLAVVPGHGALQVGFYKGKCNSTDVEATVRSIVAARFARDRSIVPALLRLQFHDCFVRGCDASILLDGATSEKNAGANQSVRGYELIDEIKSALEKACPGVVSCADIITVAARDAVVLEDTQSESLTAPSSRIARLYNFDGSGKADPTMDPALVASLRRTCPQSLVVDSPVNLDQNASSSNVVDNSFYKQILLRRGVLQIDQRIALDAATNSTVVSLACGWLDFAAQFGSAMVRMGAVEVLTGAQGEIRKSCRATNKRSQSLIEPFVEQQEGNDVIAPHM